MVEEEKIKFFVFIINGKKFVESNYDDTTVAQISDDEYEVTYGDQKRVLNLKDATYEGGSSTYKVQKLY